MKKSKKEEGKKCPLCKKSLTGDASFCYSCCTFLTHAGTEILSPDDVTDEDLRQLIKQSKKEKENIEATLRHKIGTTMSGVSIILFLLGLIIGVFHIKSRIGYFLFGASLLLMLLAVIITPGTPKSVLQMEQLEKLLAKYIAPKEIQAVFGDKVSYDPSGKLPKEEIWSQSCFLLAHNTYEGSRLIHGTYKGFPMEMSRVHLTYIWRNRHKRVEEVFYGHCLSIKTDLPIPADIHIIEKYGGFLYKYGDADPQYNFGNVFKIRCQDPSAAEEFLTPEVRKMILTICREDHGNLGISFHPDGHIFIATEDHKDEMEETLMSLISDDEALTKVKAQYREAIMMPLKILDGLLQELQK